MYVLYFLRARVIDPEGDHVSHAILRKRNLLIGAQLGSRGGEVTDKCGWKAPGLAQTRHWMLEGRPFEQGSGSGCQPTKAHFGDLYGIYSRSRVYVVDYVDCSSIEYAIALI